MAQNQGAISEEIHPLVPLTPDQDMPSRPFHEILGSWQSKMFSWFLDGGSSSENAEASNSSDINAYAEKVNDSLHELCRPVGAQKMEILFFHGLQRGTSADVHLRTWESEDGLCIWPKEWLAKEFPGARILTVSYNGIVGKSSNRTFDMKIIAENILADLMLEKIGQTRDCPVIFVGHCFGGLIIKQVCLEASARINLTNSPDQEIKLKAFLKRVKGIFYYGTPHHGNPYIDKFADAESLLLGFLKTLSRDAARLNSPFSHLCKRYKWQTAALGESLINETGLFRGVVAAPEATAKEGDEFNMVAANHLSISKPRDQKDRRFYSLTALLNNIATNWEVESEVPVFQCNGLPAYPAQLESRAQEVIRMLSGGGVLGISGMGGIGKTTLAKQVFNTISRNFEGACFVDNVKGIPSHTLDEHIRKCFHGSVVKEWVHLVGKKTLIVMDDVDSISQLKFLPELQRFGSESCLMITSRNVDVLKFYQKKFVYEVDFLDELSARKLFCLHAFGLAEIPESVVERHLLERNVEAVVDKCGRLPLTLEVLGQYLRGHESHPKIWEEAINKLGKARALSGKDDQVWASLRLSYDVLSEEEQQMFRDAATFFFETPLDKALAAWSTSFENSESSWANLVSRSMVKEVLKTKGNYFVLDISFKEVWVHEHLRDLAKMVGGGEMLSGYDDEALVLVDQLNTNKQVNAKTRTLRLRRPIIPRKVLKLDSLVKLEELKFVELRNVNLENRRKRLGRKLLYLLTCIPHEVTRDGYAGNVSLLNIGGGSFNLSTSSSVIQGFYSLAVLELKNCEVSKDFPQALGCLTNLRLLSLERLRGLVGPLSESFGNLFKLKTLVLKHLEFVTLPKSLYKLSALEYLSLCGISYLELPESLGDLSSLARLEIASIRNFAGLPESFGRKNSSLKDLYIHTCPLSKCLPHCFSKLSGLEKLFIENCPGLEELGESFGNLSALREVELRHTYVECLPSSFAHLNALEKLRIFDRFGRLKGLPDDFGQLTSLKTLFISSDSLEALPDSFHLPSSLRELDLRCKNLDMSEALLGDIVHLQELQIEVQGVGGSLRSWAFRSWAADRLPESFGNLSLLRNLSFEDCHNLRSLPDSLGKLSSLVDLAIKKCANLKSLPNSLGELSSLKMLSIEFCNNLRSLPDSLGELSSLRHLCIDYCGNLRSLPDSLGDLSSLKTLEIGRCDSVKSLPDSMGNLSSLMSVSISGCDVLESLPDSLGCISSLRKVELYNCKNLKTLPDRLGKPSLPQMALASRERCDALRSEAPGSSSQTTGAEGIRLFVERCPMLRSSVLTRLGWTPMSGERDYYWWIRA